MLDAFLEVAYVKTAQEEAEKNAIALLKQLPVMELLKIAQGEKLAWMGGCSPAGPGDPTCFLDKFRGTPLFDEALALEQEELQAEMTNLERRKENRVTQQAEAGLWEMQDELRIKKRLLELRLAQQEVMGPQAGGSAVAPLNAAPLPEAGAQGAGAPGPEAAPVEANKTAGVADKVRNVLKGAKGAIDQGAHRAGRAALEQYALHPRSTAAAALGTVGAATGAAEGKLKAKEWKEKAKDHPKSKIWQHAAKHPVRHGAITGGLGNAAVGAALGHFDTREREAISPGSVERTRAFVRHGQALQHARKSIEQSKAASASLSSSADAWGRELAIADFAKASAANALSQSADEAGRVLAKEGAGLGPFGAMAANYIKNPKNLGTVAGAGAGALSGLAGGLQKDEHGQRHLLGGLAQGAAGGALGGLAGHAAQNIGTSMRSGTPLGAAAKQYGAGWGSKIRDAYSAMQPKAPAQLTA